MGADRRADPAALEHPTVGISFILTAATESLAVLGAILAVSDGDAWLVGAAAVALVLGLAFYVFTAARFDLRQLVTGYGDHWLVGSAPNPPLWPLM